MTNIKCFTESKNWFSIYFVCIVTGCLGFILETGFSFIYYGKIVDRGILTLPICPIYSFMVLIYYFVPFKVNKTPLGIILCFFAVATGITIYEGSCGVILEQFGFDLWCYSGNIPYSLKYISLPVSICWGALGTLYILVGIPFFEKLTILIKNKRLVAIMVSAILCADCCFTAVRIAVNGGYTPIY